MKLTFEEKKEIYRKHCAGIGKRELSRQYHIRLHNIHYLLEIADRYGTSRLKHVTAHQDIRPTSCNVTGGYVVPNTADRSN